MNNKASLVYSEAFFELSKEKDKLDEHKKDLEYIYQTIEEYEDIENILNNPNVLKEDKKDFIQKIFGDLENDSMNLLKVLIDKSRFNIFKDLVKNFKKRYNKENNIAEGFIYSASKLEDEDISNIEQILTKKLEKKVELTNSIDESLIGGVSVFVEGKRIDNSIKNRLETLKSSLKERR